jgi:hypothetical protein
VKPRSGFDFACKTEKVYALFSLFLLIWCFLSKRVASNKERKKMSFEGELAWIHLFKRRMMRTSQQSTLHLSTMGLLQEVV